MTLQIPCLHVPPSRMLAIGAAFLIAVLSFPSGIASAHTSFVSSSPADGATFADPVEKVTVEFSGVSEPADDGFTVLMSDGQLRTPQSVVTLDDKVFDLTFDPPLAGGDVGVRWSVRAPDAHPITGAFSFSVAAPLVAVPVGGAAEAAVSESAPPSAESAETTDAMVMSGGGAMAPGMSMDEFMAVQPAPEGEGAARYGRIMEFSALTLLIGGAAFLATTLRGRGEEIDRGVAAVRLLGVLLAAGAVLEYFGVAGIAGESILSYWWSSPGLATLLRGVGGVAIAAGLVAVTAPVHAPQPRHSLSAAINQTATYEREDVNDFWLDDRTDPIRRPQGRSALSPVAAGGRAAAVDPLLARQHRQSGVQNPASLGPEALANRPRLTISTTPPPRTAGRVETRPVPVLDRPAEIHAERGTSIEPPVIRQWVADRASVVAYVGIGLAVISFWFDGHTVSKGPRPIHAIVNSVHVVAGSVWVGGVVAMAIVLWWRRRAGVAPRALEMVVRFSGVATFALAAVLVAGGVLAFIVLDSIGELFSTEWGQVLLLKSAAVGLALLGGAYNHLRLLPALESDPDDPEMIGRLRSIVTSEAILLGFVVVVTATLVSAAS